MNILFVCTGNTCRSPMAELYCRSRCADADFFSAGLAATLGGKISAPAAAVMAENGIDAAGFRSTPLSREKLAAADLVVPMTASHAAAIIRGYPECAAKIRRLGDFADGTDIRDPFGGDVPIYRATFAQMKIALDNLLKGLEL